VIIGAVRIAIGSTDLEREVTEVLRQLPLDPAAPAGTLIIAAGGGTPWSVMVQVVAGARAAGFTNVLMAVRPR
jgi:hypothetical protein